MLTKNDARKILERARRDPAWWVRHVLGAVPWEKQVEILEAVRDHPKTAVASCHGAGKSWVSAKAALWFLYSYPGSIVVTTAPTFRQVKRILWREIRQAWSGARYKLGGRLLQTSLELADGWMAFGFATDVPENFQGLHAKHLLVVADEAPGIEPDIWEAIDGVLTGEHCRLLAIGNPTEPAGEFYKLFQTPGVKKIHISAFDTPNFTAYGITEEDIRSGAWEEKITGPLPFPELITPAWVTDKYRRWGPGSPMYQSRVRGDFPEAASDALIPLSWIEAAQKRELEPGEPVGLGVDVARFGDDETIIAVRRGPVVRLHSVAAKEDTMQTAGRVIRALSETGAGVAKVDVIGLGAGVVDRLKEQGKPVQEMNAAEAASDPERFANRRAEWYWALRERFQEGSIDLDPDEELAAQLSSIKYRIDSRGRIQIESKEDMKKRGLPSPDRADAVVLAFANVQVSDPIMLW